MAEPEIVPIDYLMLDFPQATVTGDGMAALLDLVDREIIRILDLQFILCGEDGSYTSIELADVDHDGTFDLAIFEGAGSGLLDHDDLAQAAGLGSPASAVGIVVYENIWAARFVSAMRAKGAEVLAGGRITVGAIIDALDKLESAQ